MTNFQISQRNEVVHWEEVPFAFEHAMAGYILENYNILKLNDSSLSKVSIIDYEVPLGQSKYRADITVSYSDDNNSSVKAIVELKNILAGRKAFDQLKKYLDTAYKYKLNYSLGVLVAPDFDFEVIQEIKRSTNIYGIKISRYESNNDCLVVADVIYPEARKKDYTRYNLTNIQKITIQNLSKARLAWYIVDSYVQANINIQFDTLATIFNDEIQNRSQNCTIHLIAKETQVAEKLKCRYSSKPITLDDGTNILVSNQWNPEAIKAMIKVAENHKMNIIE